MGIVKFDNIFKFLRIAAYLIIIASIFLNIYFINQKFFKDNNVIIDNKKIENPVEVIKIQPIYTVNKKEIVRPKEPLSSTIYSKRFPVLNT